MRKYTFEFNIKLGNKIIAFRRINIEGNNQKIAKEMAKYLMNNFIGDNWNNKYQLAFSKSLGIINDYHQNNIPF